MKNHLRERGQSCARASRFNATKSWTPAGPWHSLSLGYRDAEAADSAALPSSGGLLLERCVRSSDRLVQVRILYWQDIPSLIRVTAADGTQLSRQLPDHFQQTARTVLVAPCYGFESTEVDPDIHFSNLAYWPSRKFVLNSPSQGFPEDLALAAIQEFMAEHGRRPTSNSLTAAGMTPSEKTIRNRFGSFRGAAELAVDHGA